MDTKGSNMKTVIKVLLYNLCFLFTACAVKNIEDDKLNIDITHHSNIDDWLSTTELSDDNNISSDWWKLFKDEKLDVIMNQFIANNYDLEIALLSLNANKALSIINKNNLFPDISSSFTSSAMQTNNKGTQFDDIEITIPDGETIKFAETSITENYRLNLSSQWEVDIWNKMRLKNKAIDKNFQSNQNDFKYFRFSIISQAVKIYFSTVQASQQVSLSKASVDANQEIFKIVEDRYNKGIGASLLDYKLAKSNLLISKASFEQNKMSFDQYKRRLEILIGKYPSGTIEVENVLTNSLPDIPKNMPSDVIMKRPDIVSSYNKIETALMELGYSKRLRLPSFNLTNSIGTSSGDLIDIINGDALVWSLGANVLFPIFQNGKINANIDLAKTMFEKAQIEYSNTLLSAFSEIESKLSFDQMLTKQVVLLSEALREAEDTYDLSKERYNKGLVDLITVIDTQKRMFDTRSRMILAKQLLIDNRIDLLICLGGDFSE